MTAATLEAMQQDSLVMAVARVLSAANQAARAQAADLAASLVTISEEPSTTARTWRVHYGPKDYVNRRGGDLSVLVDEQTATVQRVVRGQ
jgi:hypothetical protein